MPVRDVDVEDTSCLFVILIIGLPVKSPSCPYKTVFIYCGLNATVPLYDVNLILIGSEPSVPGVSPGHILTQPVAIFAYTAFATDQVDAAVLAYIFLPVDHVLEPVLANKPI
jgi:hypothetical protein